MDHQGWFTALYTQHLLDSQSFEIAICILQALNMQLIHCTNVFFQGRLSCHITSPSEKTRTESWPGYYLGKATRSGSCHYPMAATKCNEQPSQATANPVGGKARVVYCIYTQHLLDSQSLHITRGIANRGGR